MESKCDRLQSFGTNWIDFARTFGSTLRSTIVLWRKNDKVVEEVIFRARYSRLVALRGGRCSEFRGSEVTWSFAESEAPETRNPVTKRGRRPRPQWYNRGIVKERLAAVAGGFLVFVVSRRRLYKWISTRRSLNTWMHTAVSPPWMSAGNPRVSVLSTFNSYIVPIDDNDDDGRLRLRKITFYWRSYVKYEQWQNIFSVLEYWEWFNEYLSNLLFDWDNCIKRRTVLLNFLGFTCLFSKYWVYWLNVILHYCFMDY